MEITLMTLHVVHIVIICVSKFLDDVHHLSSLMVFQLSLPDFEEVLQSQV